MTVTDAAIDWTAGVTRRRWSTFAYASEHGDAVRGKVQRERQRQGFGERVEVRVR